MKNFDDIINKWPESWEGGMSCKYIYTKSEQSGYDATCRKLHKFLRKKELAK